jgi:antibiotic biosynthesis monooxygenase (ABM) superfamily enzyme
LLARKKSSGYLIEQFGYFIRQQVMDSNIEPDDRSKDNSTPPAPTPWMLMLAAWLVAYPTITCILIVLLPMTKGWSMPARTFLLTTIMVPLVGTLAPRGAQLLANCIYAYKRKHRR